MNPGLQGFNFNNLSSGVNKNSNDFLPEMLVMIESMPMFAADRYRKESVIERDGDLTITDGKSNKPITGIVRVISNDTITKMNLIRELAEWLDGYGELVLNFDNSIIYEARLLNQIDIARSFELDEFSLLFDCQPLSSNNWELSPAVDSPMPVEAEIPVEGMTTSITLTGADSITLFNGGTYHSWPTIVLDGTADVVNIEYNGKTLTYSNLSDESVTIDTQNYEAYDTTDTNIIKTGDVSGTFFKNYLLKGDNVVSISGTNLNLTITFNYKFKYR